MREVRVRRPPATYLGLPTAQQGVSICVSVPLRTRGVAEYASGARRLAGYMHRMTFLGHLADGFVLECGRVSLLTHGTPQVGSILASEVSTIPEELHRYRRECTRACPSSSADGAPGTPPGEKRAVDGHGGRTEVLHQDRDTVATLQPALPKRSGQALRTVEQLSVTVRLAFCDQRLLHDSLVLSHQLDVVWIDWNRIAHSGRYLSPSHGE